MSKRKILIEKSLEPASSVRRARDLALAAMRAPEYGSVIGQLHIIGQLDPLQLAAAKRWAQLAREYAEAMHCPRPPSTLALDACGGEPCDPDSIAGQKQARRHARIIAAYVEARDALRRAGAGVERALENVVVNDRVPDGWSELENLKRGLDALNAVWRSAKR